MTAALQLTPHEDDIPTRVNPFPEREPPTQPARAPFEILFDFEGCDDDEPTVRIERADITEIRSAPSRPEPLSEVVGRALERLRNEGE